MRFFSLVVLVVGLSTKVCYAQSHPSWWGFASPDATALVGIKWDALSHSTFAGPLESEFSGSLGFPDLPLLKNTRQLLLSSPATVAILYGSFSDLRAQAIGKGLKAGWYRGVELWITPGKDTLSIARISDQVIVLAARKTLETVIDRNQAESGATRHYSPLLARGARIAQGSDLWVVSTQLPDPLANLFVPLETEARGFDGGLSLREGLHLEASLDAGSTDGAAIMAENIRQTVTALPAVAQGLKVTAEADHVLMTLELSTVQVTAGLRQTEPAPAPVPVKTVEPPVPAGPQVIRIFGLDDGPREIILAPRRPE